VNICGTITEYIDVELQEFGYTGAFSAVDNLPFANLGAPGCNSPAFTANADNDVTVTPLANSGGSASYEIELSSALDPLSGQNQCTIEFTDGTNNVYLSVIEED